MFSFMSGPDLSHEEFVNDVDATFLLNTVAKGFRLVNEVLLTKSVHYFNCSSSLESYTKAKLDQLCLYRLAKRRFT